MWKGVMCTSLMLRSRRPKSHCLSRAISQAGESTPTHTCGGSRALQAQTARWGFLLSFGCFYLSTQKTSFPLLLLKLLSQLALSWDFTTPERERLFLYMKFKLASSLSHCLHSDNKEYKSLCEPLLYLSQEHLDPGPSSATTDNRAM